MKVSDLSKRMIIIISAISGVSIIISLIFHQYFDYLYFILGVLLGFAVSIAKVLLLARAVDKAVEKEKTAAANYVRLQHLLRLFLTGAVLLISVLISTASLWGAAVGILSFQISLYFLKFSSKNK